MPTVTTATSLIVAANSRRISLIITRESGNVLYLGDKNVTTASGISIIPNGNFTEDSGARQMYLGPIYGIIGSTTSVTLDVRYWERQA